MLSRADLVRIAAGRLRDAEALFKMKRYDSAIYLCGYAIEVALKARICRAVKWSAYPETRGEFQNYQSFRTHDLEVLLHLSGVEAKIKSTFMADWSTVATWDPETRYRRIGTATRPDAEAMIQSTKTLMGAL